MVSVEIKNYLTQRDPKLDQVFSVVDASGWNLTQSIRDPYTSLVSAIIGRRISYKRAREYRRQMFVKYGNTFRPDILIHENLSWLGDDRGEVIHRVSQHIIDFRLSLNNELEIRSLTCIAGIGEWTVQTTLLTAMMNWDIFPSNDKFIQARLRKLYGCENVNTELWAPYRSVVAWYLWRWF